MYTIYTFVFDPQEPVLKTEFSHLFGNNGEIFPGLFFTLILDMWQYGHLSAIRAIATKCPKQKNREKIYYFVLASLLQQKSDFIIQTNFTKSNTA